MNARVPKTVDESIYRAAAAAGVKWVIVNDWGLDYDGNAELAKGVMIGETKVGLHRFVEDLPGEMKWIGITCGFWYEWSLPVKDAYGFDFERKEVMFIDEGEARINTSTFGHVGRAVAGLLSLPVSNSGAEVDGKGGKGPSLEDYANRCVYISSFLLSQKDMFASILRVTGDKESDWSVKYEPHDERYDSAVAAMKAGDITGFARAMYTRVFWPDGSGNFAKGRRLDDEVLGLEREELDQATRRAVQGRERMERIVEGYRKGSGK